MDVGLSDHQLIYCTRKNLRIKAKMHNKVRVGLLKNYNPELLIDELTKINFLDYDIFSNVNIAYLDLVKRNLERKILKGLRIKNNTQDWFADKVTEVI